MTRQARKAYRKHPRWAWAAALGVVMAAALIAVIPAFAVDPVLQPPPTNTLNVTPTRADVPGSNFRCTTNATTDALAPTGLMTFKIPAPPKTKTSVVYTQANTAGTAWPLPKGVTITVTGYGERELKGKFFDFAITGGTVFHVGVNGGTDNTWYDYNSPKEGETFVAGEGVSGDTKLHATLGGSGVNAASWTTFCFQPGNITARCGAVLESGGEATDADAIAKFIGGKECATKVEGKRFVFTSYLEGTTRVVELAPTVEQANPPDCLPDGAGCQVVAQKIWWKISAPTSGQLTLQYDDPPYGTRGDLKFCTVDPFDRSATGADGVTLKPGLTPGAILPGSTTASLTETTCLARSTEGFDLDAEHPGLWQMIDTYSAVDGRIYG